MDISDIMYDLSGLISDAMGHLRDGDYEIAEGLLQVNAMKVVEQLPEPDKTIETVKILRKLSVIYEYQDRVDECHEAWSRANNLEKRPKFGANPHRGWNLSPPPSPDGNLRNNNNNNNNSSSSSSSNSTNKSLTREELTVGVHEAKENAQKAKAIFDTQVAANERYIASVLSIAREDSTYSKIRRVLTATSPSKSSSAKTASQTNSKKSIHGTSTTSSNQPAAVPLPTTADAASKCKLTSSINTHKRTKKNKRRVGGGKTQTIDELKKLVKSDPTIAGISALKMARKYHDIRQPKKAMQAYKTALVKELRNFDSIEFEQEDLKDRWKSIRGLKEKREAEELKATLELDWAKSENIIVSSHLGLIKLLLSSPVAALNSEIIVATMPSQIQEASAWYPYVPKTKTDLQSIYCAAPIIEDQFRKWISRFPITTRPIKRQSLLHQTINLLNGCITGPLGDLYGEVMEELLETEDDADNLKLLDLAGVYYTRRRHFRRANEILVRSAALRRGEKRSFVEPRRKLGDNLLTFGKHIDPSIDLYLSSMPTAISGKKRSDASKKEFKGIKNNLNATVWNTSKSIHETRVSMAVNGESGTYGVSTSDTWRGNIVNLVNPASDVSQDALVIPTTVGRSVDERSDSKYLLRSVGVQGQLVPTAGPSALVTRLQTGDLKSRKFIIRKNHGSDKKSGNEKWRDDLEEKRRRKGHSLMWQHHASSNIDHPQGEISKQTYNPEGIPKRHWLEPSKKEIEAREKILLAAGTAGKLPPPSSAIAISTRLHTAEEKRLTTSALAKKFGSAGLGETQRLQTVSRARVFELPPPVRNPLQTPGTRATLSSRGGMAFWMDDMQALEVTDAPSSFPQKQEQQQVVVVADQEQETKTRKRRKKIIKKTQPVKTFRDANALDFLERPPSTLPSLSKPPSAASLQSTCIDQRTVSTASSRNTTASRNASRTSR